MAEEKKYVSTSTLFIMTIAAVLGLRGFPLMATEGIYIFAYLAFASFVFLLPAALVSAELGSTFTKESGGVYYWVRAAFGSRLGSIAIWMQWSQNIIWYPITLAFAAANLAYFFGKPELVNNGIYMGTCILIIYWTALLIVLKGEKLVARITKYSMLIGVLIPGLLLVFLALFWIDRGNEIIFLAEAEKGLNKTLKHSMLLPPISGLGSVAYLAGILMIFAGIETQASKISLLKDPKREYPLAMLLTTIIASTSAILGSLAIATIVPSSEISLTAGIVQAFEVFVKKYEIAKLVPFVGLMMAFGVIGATLSWLEGPSKSLLATAQYGEIPPILSKKNKSNAPIVILLVQASLVTLISSLYFFIKDVSVAFFMLSATSATLYLIMYILMFLSSIYLRITQPHLERGFTVPFGMCGILLVAGTGFCGVAFAFVVAFFPPSQLSIGNPTQYVLLVAFGTLAFLAIPIILSFLKKPTWKVN